MKFVAGLIITPTMQEENRKGKFVCHLVLEIFAYASLLIFQDADAR